MRLAKAMVKSWEELPESRRCCERVKQFVAQRRKEPPVTLDLDDTCDDLLLCNFCGRKLGKNKLVKVVDSSSDRRRSGYAILDIFHIDEGPYQEA